MDNKERPILFSTEMVKALIVGRKTMTRRTSKLDYINSLGAKITYGKCIEASEMTYTPAPEPGFAAFFGNDKTDEWYAPIYCPYGKPGDILWVRESSVYMNYGQQSFFGYKADNGHPPDRKFKPSIHMPKAAARIWLEITDIKVERVQNISPEDIIKEGIRYPVNDNTGIEGMVSPLFKLGEKNGAINFMPEGWQHFPNKEKSDAILFAHWAELWCDINGRESWECNPFCWCVSFKVLSTTGKPDNL